MSMPSSLIVPTNWSELPDVLKRIRRHEIVPEIAPDGRVIPFTITLPLTVVPETFRSTSTVPLFGTLIALTTMPPSVPVKIGGQAGGARGGGAAGDVGGG